MRSDITTRLISSLVLMVSALAVLLFIKGLLLTGVILIIGALITYEYTNALTNIGIVTGLYMPSAVLVTSLLTVYQFDIMLLGALHLLTVTVMLFLFFLYLAYRRPAQAVKLKWLMLYIIWIVLPLCIFYYISGTPSGSLKMLFLVLLISVGDSAAYLIGRRFGKRKLMPSVSPGKTVEGAVASLIFSLAAGMIYLMLTGITGIIGGIIACVLCNIAAQAGDLAESKFKRICLIKDTSALIAGHGGVMDRLDAYLFAVPVYFILTFFI